MLDPYISRGELFPDVSGAVIGVGHFLKCPLPEYNRPNAFVMLNIALSAFLPA